MSERRHTPGPWAVENGDWPHTGTLVITARHVGMTARTPLAHVAGEFDDAAKPDAHLIAAAPDMLEALELVWGKVLTEYHHPDSYVRQQVEAAIARARGQSDHDPSNSGGAT